ncbi:MAG: hypothetical protein H0V49_13420 [Nocardioidaceae bacterium]|nr:hypothetical protein [Nocardioidaceae bacterium]
MAVHGLTVTSGTTPDTFNGEVLGVLDDGIAPGLDMIMVQLHGAQIADANGNVDKGIWAGMSGSPVYTANGRLIGAVAYGLSWSPSDVAGVTPGAEMLKLLSTQPNSPALKTAASTKKISIPGATADRLVSSGAMSTAQASSGFKRLPMPMSVSGLSNRHLQMAADSFNIKRPLVVGGSTSAAAPASPIVAGGNLAASLSYGDITYAGIGTATAVCNDEVLAFGHPMLWSGHSTLTMHGADAIYIQRDNVFGSFKVANPTAPVGQIVGDHLAGIHGLENVFPKYTEVTSHVEATNGNSRNGKTMISYRAATPFLSAIHLLSNADRVLDQLGGGTATVHWTFSGTRADGSDWTFKHGDRFASKRDITFESIFESYRQMGQILHNKFERVEITDVHFKASYSPKYYALKIAKLQIKPADRWITIRSSRRPKTVHAGTDLPVRVTLTPSKGEGEATIVKLSVRVPKAAGGEGVLFVGGGGEDGRIKATSFDDLLVKLADAPRNSEVTATLRAESKRRGISKDVDTQIVGDVVSGSKHVWLNVR